MDQGILNVLKFLAYANKPLGIIATAGVLALLFSAFGDPKIFKDKKH